MPVERQQNASWPGVLAVHSARVTLSHGITPGVINLTTLPQASPPAETGILALYDGVEAIRLIDCKISQVTSELSGAGFIWHFAILDRRWKWRELGEINGSYNQLDNHGKLIPWTIRSPTELAILCLTAMGETGYSIDLPPGLDSSVGALAYKLNPPWIGVTDISGVNPPIEWKAVAPAQALANLCEQFGRRIIYQWRTNTILIAIPGIGGLLPGGSISKDTPALTVPATPTGITIQGSPTIFQDYLPLEAVGLEWDESLRPIDTLSYAPLDSDRKVDWQATDGHQFWNVNPTSRLTYLEAVRLAQKSIYRYYRVCDSFVNPPPPNVVLNNPYAGPIYTPTAIRGGIKVQGYGTIQRRQQIVLRDTQVSQVTPQANDDTAIDARTGLPITVNFYNGYSRDKPAAVYGSISKWLQLSAQLVFWPTTAAINTDKADQVLYTFSVDPEQQCIVFSQPIYRMGIRGPQAAELLLLTGFYIRNAVDNHLEVFELSKLLPGMKGVTNFAVKVCPDVQLGVIAGYRTKGTNQQPSSPTILESDPITRATYYLNGQAAQYINEVGETIEYNGIRAIDLDGAIMQVSWEVGPSGCKTTASRNSEHSIYVRPYPARRRAEMLTPRPNNERVVGLAGDR